MRAPGNYGWLAWAALLAWSLSTANAAEAQAPAMLPVQGLLTDSDGVRVDEPTTLEFAIYGQQAAGEPLFTELHSELPVVGGNFIVYLGEVAGGLDLSMFRDRGELWLELTVNGEDVIEPRFRLGSVPYAAFSQYCGDAATLTGAEATDFAAVDHTHDWTQLVNVPVEFTDGDQDTTYDGTDFGRSNQACPAGQVVTGIDAEGNVVCAPDKDTTYGGQQFARSNQNCPAGTMLTGIDANGSIRCTSFAEAAKAYVNQNCYIYFGWRDSCDGCGSAPAKVGRVSDASCTNLAGGDNSCITPSIGGRNVRMYGVNTDGDVNGDDKFYVGLKCH